MGKIIKYLRLSLFAKFVLWMGLLAIVPVIFTGWQLIEINRKGLQGTILELHTHLAQSLSEKITTYLNDIEDQMSFVIKAITEGKGQSQIVLQALLDSNQDFASISLVNKSGNEIFKVYNEDLFKDPKLLNLADHAIFKAMWDTKNTRSGLLSNVYFADLKPRINALYKISDTHLIFAAISLENLWNNIEQTQLGKTGYAFLIDSNGTVIAHPDKTHLEQKVTNETLPILVEALKSVSVGSKPYTRPDGTEIVGAYAPVPELQWVIIIEQNKSEAFLTATQSFWQATIIGLGVIIIAIVIAYLLARGLSRPIMHLIHGAERVASGDFTAEVDVQTRDELEDLADTFNSMTRKLKQYADLQVDKIIAEKTKTEAIIFSIADGIIMTDHDGHIQLINNQALNIFEIPADNSYEGKMIYDLIPKDIITNTLKEIIAKSHRDDVREIDLSSKETARFYKVNAGKVTALKGDDLGTVTVVHDITLEKQIDNMKEEFLHSITHDLRNPMTSIRGFLKFLIDGVAGEVNQQQMKMLLTVNKASEKLLIMINDILDIAKLEAGKIELDLEETNFKDIGMHVMEIVEGLAQRKHITLEMKADETLPLIKADTRFFERVITNLLSNSVKFTPEEGKVILEMHDETDQIKVSVIDNGEGIPSDYLDKIFDKFGQVTGQRKGGTGLGLTICKYVVEGHLGKIWVESKLGEGSKFIFTVPKNLTILKNGEIACA
ncbi:MAG: ATP-binding protein [bacterium]